MRCGKKEAPSEQHSWPPLCKGRWGGASRAGRIVRCNVQLCAVFGRIRNIYSVWDNPSVAPRQLPLHKGAEKKWYQHCLFYSLMALYIHNITHAAWAYFLLYASGSPPAVSARSPRNSSDLYARAGGQVRDCGNRCCARRSPRCAPAPD